MKTKIVTYRGAPVAILDYGWFGLRVKIDFVLNHKPFWVWKWQINYVELGQ